MVTNATKKTKKQMIRAPQRQTIEVPCAFCGGKGRDPFSIMSPMATCQVCGGKGSRRLHPPTVRCAFCRGTGVYAGTRLTCTTCKGLGTVEVPINTASCPCCDGTGRAVGCDGGHWPDAPLSCTCCGGKGVVAAKQVQVKGDTSRGTRE